MSSITKEYAKEFMKQQEKLFDFPVTDTVEEALEFLNEDCCTTVFDTLDEVFQYMKEEGIDTEGATKDNIDDILELFAMPDGKYLFVEA